MSKIEIGQKEIDVIKDQAHKVFLETNKFPGNETKDIQFYCILSGLESFLTAKGVEVKWILKK